MVNVARRTWLSTAFAALMRDLSTSWPETDLADIREGAEQYEFDDALENLVASSVKLGRPFSPDQRRQVNALASYMGLGDLFAAPWAQPARPSLAG